MTTEVPHLHVSTTRGGSIDDRTQRPQPTPPRPSISFRSSYRTPALGITAMSPEKLDSWRRMVGLGLLSMVVILWTASGFLQSSIFADNTYSKPYFVTYINTAFFTLPLAPYLLARTIPPRTREWIRLSLYPKDRGDYEPVHKTSDDEDRNSPRGNDFPAHPRSIDGLRSGRNTPSSYDSFERNRVVRQQEQRRNSLSQPQSHLSPPLPQTTHSTLPSSAQPPLTTRETFSLSVRFCLLWYSANYFNSASYHFTTVASVTIFSTTSSIFTLIFGSITGVERFTTKKLLGVLACLAGVILTTMVEAYNGDDGSNDDESRGIFPPKTGREILIGDALALAAAALYGAYTVLLVKTVGSESRIRMPLFFGFLGLVNTLCLWPGFILLHFTDIEHFRLPQNSHIWVIIVVNGLSSLVSDLCWAYAMLFTSPLVVTVGLSLTIPLSLVGQIILDGYWGAGVWYWIGAGVVVGSFVFVNAQAGGDGVQEVVGDEGHIAEGEGLVVVVDPQKDHGVEAGRRRGDRQATDV